MEELQYFSVIGHVGPLVTQIFMDVCNYHGIKAKSIGEEFLQYRNNLSLLFLKDHKYTWDTRVRSLRLHEAEKVVCDV